MTDVDGVSCGTCYDIGGSVARDASFKNLQANAAVINCINTCTPPTTGFPLLIANSLFVNQLGNDTGPFAGQRERFDRQFLTIQAALNAALPGDVVYVYPGNLEATPTTTYNENLVMPVGVSLVAMDGFSGLLTPQLERAITLAGNITIDYVETGTLTTDISGFAIVPAVNDSCVIIGGGNTSCSVNFADCSMIASGTGSCVQISDSTASQVVLLFNQCLMSANMGASYVYQNLQHGNNTTSDVAFQDCFLVGFIDEQDTLGEHILALFDSDWEAQGLIAGVGSQVNSLGFEIFNCIVSFGNSSGNAHQLQTASVGGNISFYQTTFAGSNSLNNQPMWQDTGVDNRITAEYCSFEINVLIDSLNTGTGNIPTLSINWCKFNPTVTGVPHARLFEIGSPLGGACGTPYIGPVSVTSCYFDVDQSYINVANDNTTRAEFDAQVFYHHNYVRAFSSAGSGIKAFVQFVTNNNEVEQPPMMMGRGPNRTIQAQTPPPPAATFYITNNFIVTDIGPVNANQLAPLIFDTCTGGDNTYFFVMNNVFPTPSPFDELQIWCCSTNPLSTFVTGINNAVFPGTFPTSGFPTAGITYTSYGTV